MKTLTCFSIALTELLISSAVLAQTTLTKPTTAASKSPRPAASKAVSLTPPASQEQIDAAERTHFGDYACEFNQKIHVSLHDKQAGYVEVKHLSKVFVMKPVISSTGALRLEDVRGQTLLIQIANKSMLMDVKAGQRIVDSCVHAAQNEFNKTAPAGAPVMN